MRRNHAVPFALSILVLVALACGSNTTTTSKTNELASPTTVAAVAGPTATTAPGQPTATPAPPKDTATPVPPTATVAPKGEAKVEVIDSTHIKSGGAFLYYYGIVKNTGTAPADEIKVVVSLLDESGGTVATGNDIVLTGVKLDPGKTVGFKILVDGAPEKWAKETFQVESATYDPKGFNIFGTAKGLSLTGDKLKPASYGDGFTITGQVKNGGDKAANLIHVIATGYDDKGKVVAVEQGYSKLDNIAPGQSGPFSIDLSQPTGKVVKYDLFVTGVEKDK